MRAAALGVPEVPDVYTRVARWGEEGGEGEEES